MSTSAVIFRATTASVSVPLAHRDAYLASAALRTSSASSYHLTADLIHADHHYVGPYSLFFTADDAAVTTPGAFLVDAGAITIQHGGTYRIDLRVYLAAILCLKGSESLTPRVFVMADRVGLKGSPEVVSYAVGSSVAATPVPAKSSSCVCLSDILQLSAGDVLRVTIHDIVDAAGDGGVTFLGELNPAEVTVSTDSECHSARHSRGPSSSWIRRHEDPLYMPASAFITLQRL